MVIENVAFEPDKKYDLDELDITPKEVKEILHIESDGGLEEWMDKILLIVNSGYVENNKAHLIRYLTGISDGWVRS